MKKSLSMAAIVALATTLSLLSCATPMRSGTSATLRPDLTKDEDEIWEISSRGNGFTSVETVEKNAIQRAALTADAEGYDCFVLLDSDTDVKTYSYTNYEKKTVNSSSYGSYGYSGSTNYYSGYGNYLGKSNNSGNIHGSTYTSQEVYVPETYNVKRASVTLYAVFKEHDECLKLNETKWRKNIYYNEDILPTIR